MKKQNKINSAHNLDGEKNKVQNSLQFSQLRQVKESSPKNNTSTLQSQLFNQHDQKWSEIKIHGKNICRRSYHSAVVHENRMYIYGGYEVNEGILGDFYEMIWQKVNLSTQQSNNEKPIQPGPLMRHSAVSYKDKMFIFGGNQQALKPTNQLWSFDYNEDQWELVKPKGKQVPPNLDSHSATVDVSSHCMYIFGGFSDNIKDGGYQNSVWKYDFESEEWTLLGEKSALKPCKRAGSSISISGSTLFMFGGTIVDSKFNDTWEFDINAEQWSQIKTEKDDILPETRNGHTLLNYKEKLILFGGIHDLTHEKNDLYIFNVKTKKWSVVDDNTSHCKGLHHEDMSAFESSSLHELGNESILRLQNNKSHLDSSKLSSHQSKKAHYHSQSKSKVKTFSQSELSAVIDNSSQFKTLKRQNDNGNSTTKKDDSKPTLEENRKRRELIKKMNLLSEFELNDKEKKEVRPISPITESMKNCIVTVGNPSQKKIYSLKNLDGSLSRISNNNDNIQKKIVGKRPYARDGHSAVVSDNFCYIFGGDRHMMSYNDLYQVDLDLITEPHK